MKLNLEQLGDRTMPYSAIIGVTNHVAVLTLQTYDANPIVDRPVLIDVSRTANGDMQIQLQGIGSKMPDYFYHFTGVEIDVTGPQPVTVEVDNSCKLPVVVNGTATVLHGDYPAAVYDTSGWTQITVGLGGGVNWTPPPPVAPDLGHGHHKHNK